MYRPISPIVTYPKCTQRTAREKAAFWIKIPSLLEILRWRGEGGGGRLHSLSFFPLNPSLLTISMQLHEVARGHLSTLAFGEQCLTFSGNCDVWFSQKCAYLHGWEVLDLYGVVGQPSLLLRFFFQQVAFSYKTRTVHYIHIYISLVLRLPFSKFLDPPLVAE